MRDVDLDPSATFYNTPGSVNEFLAWAGGLEEGNRGEPASRGSPGSFQIVGTEQCMKNLSHILVTQTARAVKRLKLNCELILAESQKEVPVDMTYDRRLTVRATKGRLKFSYVRGRLKGGFLKSTGTVESLDDESFQIGYNTPYAHRQHEDLTYRHTRPGAKAKYLEDPVMRRLPFIADDIVNSLREFMV